MNNNNILESFTKFKFFSDCNLKNCNSYYKKIAEDTLLIKYQQKIMKTKSINDKNKYIVILNNLLSQKNYNDCLIKYCDNAMLEYYKDNLKDYKEKIEKLEKLEKKDNEIPKLIKDSIKICEYILSKNKIKNDEYKLLKYKMDLLNYYFY